MQKKVIDFFKKLDIDIIFNLFGFIYYLLNKFFND